MSAEGTPKPVTLGELVRSVLDEASGRRPMPVPPWPPDVFAVAATVIKQTGTYLSLAGLPNPADGRTGEKQARLHLSGVHPIMMDDVDHLRACCKSSESAGTTTSEHSIEADPRFGRQVEQMGESCNGPLMRGEPPPDTSYPMLQPYQATALTMALCSRIRAGNGTELFENGWPKALVKFSEWLNYAPPSLLGESQFWHALNDDEDLKSVIRCLYDDRATPASEFDTQVTELRRLLPG
jgi:hypothetical protein